jgi:hypothetical protein
MKDKLTWGISEFCGRNKVREIKFKTEKDMAYFLYKTEKI